MDTILVRRLTILTITTSVLVISNSLCVDESMMTNLLSRENVDAEYSKPREAQERMQRSLNVEELRDWGPKNSGFMKLNSAANRAPNSLNNLPLRFGRTFQGERSIKPFVNLPLRFGRHFESGIPRHLPNLPQRFGRTTASGVSKAFSNLAQKLEKPFPPYLLRYSTTRQPWTFRRPQHRNFRNQNFNSYLGKKSGGGELSQENLESRILT
ncbi:pro-FMRFamide-related neuropeptide VF [Ornithorhynchus anatinus]|uniref:Pro-FMRFamide-related neuropeptide VF n=2 Tax=Ornithorhynchus anatinus TaxID=9258 RepID=K7E9N1_ORNAN|nr:pro-FMRFamide-related neuropeptide VF [Ornithorhynchus anatinus]